MLWAAYALPVLLRVLRGLKKDTCLDLSVYTKAITCNHEHVQSRVDFQSINPTGAFLSMMVICAKRGEKTSVELPSESESDNEYRTQIMVELNDFSTEIKLNCVEWNVCHCCWCCCCDITASLQKVSFSVRYLLNVISVVFLEHSSSNKNSKALLKCIFLKRFWTTLLIFSSATMWHICEMFQPPEWCSNMLYRRSWFPQDESCTEKNETLDLLWKI